MTRRSHRSRPALRTSIAAVAAVFVAGACSPPNNIDAGLNSYSTDIVMGSQTKAT